MHFIHARHIGETPWGWRDGVVESVGPDGWVHVRYLAEDAVVRVWHHDPLAQLLAVGDPVRVHERYYSLGGLFGWLNVVVRGGLGPVPQPDNAELWAQETTGGVVDLSTGRGLALDHPQAADDEDGTP